MADEILIFDAAASNVDGTDPGSPLSIGPGTSYPMADASFPSPPLNVLYASSVDTEGEIPVSRRYGNRTITIRLEMAESGANDTLLDALQVKFAKFQREGGTLKRTRKDGSSVRIYDIVAGDGWDPVYDFKYVLGNLSEVTMTLPARPLARGAEQDLGDNVETTLPCLVFTEASVPGDVEALGRLVIDNDVAVDQNWFVWGLESRNYSSSANAALFYEAEGRTALGGSAIAVGPSGASGAGSNVMRNTALTTSYQAVLSTQATGGGAHLSHIGQFRVYARVQTPTSNTGAVSVAFEWAAGDFRRYTRNTSASIDATWEGTWRRLDLGLVNIEKVAQGTQRWEGRIVASSTVAGDDIDIDWVMLVPVAEGSGVASSVMRFYTPTSFSARDEFDQTAGGMNGKTLPVGGTWATVDGGSGTTDFQIGSGVASRQATGTRYALAGATTFTNVATNVKFRADVNASSTTPGIIARYVDTSNFAYVIFDRFNGSTIRATVSKRVGSAVTLQSFDTGVGWPTSLTGYATATFTILANGVWNLRVGPMARSGYDPDMATGGTLASGRSGIFHSDVAATVAVNFDDFWVAAPPADAAIFASQSAELRHDGVIREDSGGSFWQPPSSYEGDYLRVPPSGAEARTLRMLVSVSRTDPAVGADSATDDLSARLFVTPRYL